MRRSAKRRLAVLAAACALAGGTGFGIAYAGNFVSDADYDFDCDGVRDMVVGNTSDYVNGVEGAGSVTVAYSSTGARHRITQASSGIPGAPEKHDMFGWTHTAYDRDKDGCDDLMVGIPYEDLGSEENAGMICFIPGSPTGLDTSKSVGYSQNSQGYPGVGEDFDWFGYSLAAGVTASGTPYLLIGSPGESGASAETWQSGSVYYVRSGTVSAFTQNTSGVPGSRQTGDYFGERLAASDRFFVVGSPQETLYGSRWDDPPSGAYGMVHVFSHTLTSGRPTPVAGITQNTPGLSGVAEPWDFFGYGVSILSYRPSSGSAVGALVAVGSSLEKVGSQDQAGMAHLLYVSPSGGVRQIAAVTQNTSGVTGAPEDGDYLGYDTVLADLEQGSAVATPETAIWAVGVGYEDTASGNRGAVHIFKPGWQPGQPDVWLEDGRYGVPENSIGDVARLRASSSSLHVGGWGICTIVPWTNLLAGGELPATKHEDDCR